MKRVIARKGSLLSRRRNRLCRHRSHTDRTLLSCRRRDNPRCPVHLLARRRQGNVVPEPRSTLPPKSGHQKRSDRVNGAGILSRILPTKHLAHECEISLFVVKKSMIVSGRRLSPHKGHASIGEVSENLKNVVHFLCVCVVHEEPLKKASSGPLRDAFKTFITADDPIKRRDSN